MSSLEESGKEKKLKDSHADIPVNSTPVDLCWGHNRKVRIEMSQTRMLAQHVLLSLTIMTAQTRYDAHAYRKGTVHNEEETQNEQAGLASMCLLQLGQRVADGGLISAVDVRVCNGPKHQDCNKQKHSRPAQKTNVACSHTEKITTEMSMTIQHLPQHCIQMSEQAQL